MSTSIYHQCCKYRGRVVGIVERNGRVHHGKIVNVTPTHVYIQPVRRSLGGLGYGFWGGGFGLGLGYGIALGAIGGLALGGLFW